MKKLYAVYDTVAEEIITGPIMVLPNDAAARRFFQDLITDQRSNLSTHPKDYDLVCLGEINTGTGSITTSPNGNIETVVSGQSVIHTLERYAADREKSPIADPAQLQIPEDY